jgi:hypothetical protein
MRVRVSSWLTNSLSARRDSIVTIHGREDFSAPKSPATLPAIHLPDARIATVRARLQNCLPQKSLILLSIFVHNRSHFSGQVAAPPEPI